MTQFRSLERMPDELKELFLSGNKSVELHKITYISSCRPDPRDVTNITLLEVVAHIWAKDCDDARAKLAANIPTEVIGGLDTALNVLSLVHIEPLGISSESVLRIAQDEDETTPTGPVGVPNEN